MTQKKISFHYQNLEILLHKNVYEPAEDTFLLLDSIDASSKDKMLEIGTGTGIIALACAQKGAKVICSDINPFAIELVKKNRELNKNQISGSIEIRKGSLFEVVKHNETFNLIIFNPPYLTTRQDEQVDNGWFDKAVAGGKTGLDTTIPFLSKLSEYLTNSGKAFTILSTQSPREPFNQILRDHHLKTTIINSLSFTDETIEVHKITKK